MNSLVIPVYRNEANLDRLLAELVKLAGFLPEFEVVFVVDGSPDRSSRSCARDCLRCRCAPSCSR